MDYYLCRNCINNKNNWCIKKKCSCLKTIRLMACDYYINIENIAVSSEAINFEEVKKTYIDKPNKKSNVIKFQNDFEIYRILGQREMLWNIQKGLMNIDESSMRYKYKYLFLIECIKALGEELLEKEKIWELDEIVINSLDKFMIEKSRNANNDL